MSSFSGRNLELKYLLQLMFLGLHPEGPDRHRDGMHFLAIAARMTWPENWLKKTYVSLFIQQSVNCDRGII